MSAGYTKLFATITDSTIWQAPDPTRLVWITMLSMADQNGYVGASVPGLAARARVALEDCVAALETLLGPDKWSRTPDHGGRRIAVADGGWVLLNHAKYRAMRDADKRREQARLAMAKLRAERKGLTVSNVSLGSPPLAQAEAEAEAEAKKGKTPRKRGTPLPEGFKISDNIKTWAEIKYPTPPLQAYLEFFIGRMKASGKTYVDWDQAFQNCIREDWPGLRKAGKALAELAGAPELICGKCLQPITGSWTMRRYGKSCEACEAAR